jgi:indole-3-glycerol phosphate synthase
MTILDQIIKDKAEEVANNKKCITIGQLKEYLGYRRQTVSIKHRLAQAQVPGIIAEHKRKSPSKGIINKNVQLEEVVLGYQQAGVQAISILTDYKYFMGNTQDVVNARGIVDIPILRKEFMIDDYQVYEAKAIGADFILLIAACLSKMQSEHLAGVAKEIGLEVLIEIHTEKELKAIPNNVDMVGVNNRDLKTFEVDILTSVNLADGIPDQFVKISESGISDIGPIQLLWKHGYKGFLIGENFMKAENPGQSCKAFINKLS